ncbi:hypothetical protein [Pseudonocardia sp. T1-2H]|uniref:hypothetical protein n=1 Tax=Pseudonocardia sp. T1-2H TaxID=3128899 RepID=UPI00310126B0
MGDQLMAVNYRFAQGVDLPSWHWLSEFPAGASNPGTSNVYDGNRYIYWAVQYGTTTAGTASTTQLWRYCTWTNGWQFLAGLTAGNQGIDLEFDPVRNVVWLTIGAALTEWRYFNLNSTSLTLCGLTTGAFTLSSAIATVLPATATVGASLALINDLELVSTFDSGAAAAGSTTTSIVSANAPGTFLASIVGLQIRFTSGALAGQKRIITSVTSPTVLGVTRAFGGAPAAADTWVIEVPSDTAAAGSTTTTLVTTGGLPAGVFANADVVITGGTGSGQRRRIGSHDATTLTLAGAVAGNPRTGAWTTTPDATSTYQIVPSSDFLYFLVGNNSTAVWKIDVMATTLAWTAVAALPGTANGGANFMHPASSAPFRLVALRGNGTANIYFYDPGNNSWSTPTVLAASETFTTGASSALMPGRRKMFIQKEGSPRCYILDLVTGALDGAGFMPYASPAGYDGHRARYVKSASGVEWLYLLRAGGQEFYRLPVEWL